MTSAAHASGTDRIAEVAARRGWADDEIVVNVQGDEPLLPPSLIAQVAALLAANPAAAIATLATPIASDAEYLDPNVVKVVARADGMALYFSRAPIPWDRDGCRVQCPRAGNATAARGATSASTPTAYPPCARSQRHRRRRSSAASASSNCGRSRSAFRSPSRMPPRRRDPASTRPRTSRGSTH